VVANSLAETELRGMQPAAVAVRFPNLAAAFKALQAGQVQGVIGDTLLLANQTRAAGAQGLALTPDLPYERYAVACALPENDSAFRNLANLAIAQLLQGYVDGQPEAVAAVDRWVGPSSSLRLSQAQIRTYFETVLLGVEAIRPLPVAAGSSSAR
jgi:polar amino acid transport system substrate-binding protein